jgi:hypothetical protein
MAEFFEHTTMSRPRMVTKFVASKAVGSVRSTRLTSSTEDIEPSTAQEKLRDSHTQVADMTKASLSLSLLILATALSLVVLAALNGYGRPDIAT